MAYPTFFAAYPTRIGLLIRHFGDLGDPESKVSKLVQEREGFDLLPTFGYKPVNKYLPPRPRKDTTGSVDTLRKFKKEQDANADKSEQSSADKFFAWADLVLSR